MHLSVKTWIVVLFVYCSNVVLGQDYLKPMSTISERWELEDSLVKGNFLVTPYKPVYFTAGRWTSKPNRQPVSENPAYSLPIAVSYNNYEAKFQFSLKTKIVRGLINGNGDVWVTYTQQAHWQIYNAELSRPFRELNYQPEVIVNFKTDYNVLGFKGRMLGFIFNHQSNGRSIPLSRSWNRMMLQAGFDRKNWQVYLRPWIRLSDSDDENPAIVDYLGRGEAVVVYNAGRHQLSATMSHALDFDNLDRGNFQMSWTLPIFDNFRLMLQLTRGYGETLIDYNHFQTTAGLSVALVDW